MDRFDPKLWEPEDSRVFSEEAIPLMFKPAGWDDAWGGEFVKTYGYAELVAMARPFKKDRRKLVRPTDVGLS